MFGEKKEEMGRKLKKKIPTYTIGKYNESKEKAIELINDKKYGLKESDFWILMNESGDGSKMQYTGLIISHNGCLKINDKLEEKDKFDPHSVSVDKSGYNDSLVYTYINRAQGIYEVGEVSASNCKNAYPYAMAFKRLFDRVVLKISKVAFSGIYGEDEADEFRQPVEAPEEKEEKTAVEDAKERLATSKKWLVAAAKQMGVDPVELMKKAGLEDGKAATQEQVDKAILMLKEMSNAKGDN